MHSTPTNIALATFNCRSLKRSAEQIRKLTEYIDILALQETWTLPHDLGFVNELNQHFSCFAKSAVDTSAGILKGRPYGGLALMWRKSLFPSVSIIDCTSERLAAVQIDLGGRYILVMSVYLPYDDGSEDCLANFISCLGSIEAVISDSDVEAIYVLGDFNAHCGTRFGNELLAFCKDHLLVCVDTEVLAPDTFTHVNDGSGSKRWLDHCVVTSAARTTVISACVDLGVYWSDHFPLLIKCEMDILPKKTTYSTENGKLTGVHWGNRDVDETSIYSKNCCDNLRDIGISSHFLNCLDCSFSNFNVCKTHLFLLDDYYDNIVTILQESAKISVCRDVPKRHRKVLGWNYHVRESHQRARYHFQCWLCCGKPQTGVVYNSMVKSRKVFKNKLRWCQNNEDQIRMDILASHQQDKNFVKFWKATKRLNHKSNLPISVDDEQDPKLIADLFSHHFKIDPLPALNKNCASMHREQVFTKDGKAHRYSPEDVAKIVLKMKKGKAPGFDGLSLEHILYAGDEIFVILADLFTICINSGHLPKNLMRTVVVPVPKNKSGDLASLNNYRPISLGTIIGKVLERLIYFDINNNIKIDDAQFGFRPGLSTDSAIFSLKSTVNYYVNRDTSVYACFLDLSRAFDLVNYQLLWQKLLASKVPLRTVDLLRYWYENQTNFVKWGDAISNDFRLECGVRQGGLTSPDLFSLYVNDLIEELRSTGVGCHIGPTSINNISYADDMVLLSPSIRGLRRLLNICEQYARDHGLKYNVKKTQMMIFRAGKGPERIPSVYLDGVQVKKVEQFRYLGHILTEDLRDNLDVERERRALAVRCNMLARRFARCSVDAKLTLFRAYCQCFYTCQLWVNCTNSARSSIRVQYNNAYRILMKLPKYCSASGMFADARVSDFFAIIRSRVAAFWSRVRNSKNEILSVCSRCPDNSFVRYWLSVHRDNNHK